MGAGKGRLNKSSTPFCPHSIRLIFFAKIYFVSIIFIDPSCHTHDSAHNTGS